MKSVTFKALTSCVLLASTLQAHAQQEAAGQDGKGEERNVMLNAADANKPREIQIGLPSEDVNVYENGLPAVYSSSVHKLSAHWRNDASLGSTGLLSPSESAITTGNIAYAVTGFTDFGQQQFHGKLNYRMNHFGMQNFDLNFNGGIGKNWLYNAGTYQNFDPVRSNSNLPIMPTARRFIMQVLHAYWARERATSHYSISMPIARILATLPMQLHSFT